MQVTGYSGTVMIENQEILPHEDTDRCIQLANGFFILAQKELSAFMSAVDELFGAEQAHQSALDWIEEMELMDWPAGDSIPDWRRATIGASSRLALYGAAVSAPKGRH